MINKFRQFNPHAKIARMTQSSSISKIKGQIEAKKQQLAGMVKNNMKTIGISSIVIFAIIFYFVVFFRRVPRFLSRMDTEYNHACKITSLENNDEIMAGNYKLKDFFIASSYKSYLPCTNYLDYSCLDAIKKTLFYGARYIDLDVMNFGFNCTNLVVCAGRSRGNWNYTTSLDLEKTLQFIAKYAFGSEVPNSSDPLFLNINLNTWYNAEAYDICAQLILKYFSHKMLPIQYGYQGHSSRENICDAPIKSLFNKVIIMCNNDVKGTAMDEIVNMGSYEYGNIRNVTYGEINNCKDIKEFREFNKTYMTRVVPSFTGRMKKNFNFLLPYYLGCQFICMNYTEPDQWMKAYVNRFSSHSFILKPYKLRHRIDTTDRPFENSY